MNLHFKRQSLLYDIGNYAYIAGHRLETETGDTVLSHLLTDICVEGNADRVARVLAVVYAGVAARLAANSDTEHPECYTDELWEPDEYVITVSDALTAQTCRYLEHLIHEYLVYRVIADWLSLTHPSYATEWHDKAAAIGAEISALTASAHPHRRKLPPM